MLRAVVDANVLISAMISQAGAPARILDAWRAGAFEMIASQQLFAEVDRVLQRPHVHARVAVAAGTTVPLLHADAVVIEDPPAARVVPSDPDDDYLVALALAGGANVIVTGDKDLLEAEVGVRVMSPREFAALLETLPS